VKTTFGLEISALFTDAHWEIEEMIDAGDQVVTRGLGDAQSRLNEHRSDRKTGVD
jgi:hypothetical protein